MPRTSLCAEKRKRELVRSLPVPPLGIFTGFFQRASLGIQLTVLANVKLGCLHSLLNGYYLKEEMKIQHSLLWKAHHRRYLILPVWFRNALSLFGAAIS